MEKRQEKLSEKEWFALLMLFLFFPVGLYLMWANKHFNLLVRVIVTFIIVMFAIMAITTGEGGQQLFSGKRF